jgi:uncharacterized protein (TIGR04255 family)
MPSADYNPLIDLPPEEIHLPHSPLERVIAQLRFPLILNIQEKELVGKFQKAIYKFYPILRAEQSQTVILNNQSFSQQPDFVWRFSEEKGKWRVSLSSTFLALETTEYSGQKDFNKRLGEVLHSLSECFELRIVDRLGVRYINRLKKPAYNRITEMVNPQVLGLAGSIPKDQIIHSLTETLFDLPKNNARLQARWGYLPANTTIDPSLLDSIGENSWILDMDMFSTQSRQFNEKKILDEIEVFTDRIYALFRWAITDKFLREFGGNL